MVSSVNRFQADLEYRYGPHDVKTRNAAPTRCRLDFMRLGPFDVGVARGVGVSWYRKHGQLDEMWRDRVFLLQQRSGRSVVEHLGKTVTMDAQDLVLADSIGNCSFGLLGEGALLCFDLPRHYFEQGIGVSNSLMQRIDGSKGVGRSLSSLMRSFTEFDTDFDADDRETMFQTVQSMVNRSVARRRDHKLGCSKTKDIVADLKRWALERIDSPDLTPQSMALACGLSRRQLYRVFENEGLTPSAWVWQLRLDVAFTYLRHNPDRRVIDAALAVGFNDAAHFSRLFKDRFGHSPKSLLLRERSNK